MNVFDILGPIMIGPSSSHTAGAVRLGQAARALLDRPPVSAHLELHGSFAKTYKGHGTDKALIAGILGFATDDERIRSAHQLAKRAGLSILLEEVELNGAHPNTARISLTDANGHNITIRGASIGGGNIIVDQINGLETQFTGQYATLIILHKDVPGTIAAVTELLASHKVNICNFHLTRQQKGGEAVMTIELEGHFSPILNTQLETLPNIITSTILEPI